MPHPPAEGSAKSTSSRSIRSLHDDAASLAAIVESSDDAIYAKDPQARITSWNAAAERLYGYSGDEAIGKPVGLIIPPEKHGEELEILEKILRGQRVDHFETKRITKNGEMVEVSISVSPVRNADGEIVEAAIIARDITERKRLQGELERAREERANAARQQALQLNDDVVQGLAIAKMALEAGDHDQGLEALTATLTHAQSIVSTLLDEHSPSGAVRPGDLKRKAPAPFNHLDPPS